MLIDPGRYVEYVSVRPHLSGPKIVFGLGYGFRYRLIDFEASQESVSNAHFTPLGIVLKFGLVGVSMWLAAFFYLFLGVYPRTKIEYAAHVSLFGIFVQSLFAYGFFINSLTAICCGLASISGRKGVK
jgi:hypothetical protein